MRISDWSSDVCSSDLLAVEHFLRRLDDHLAEILVQYAERHVGAGHRLLDDAEGANDGQRLLFPADLEIAERADRKSVGEGNSVVVRLDLGVRSSITKKNTTKRYIKHTAMKKKK